MSADWVQRALPCAPACTLGAGLGVWTRTSGCTVANGCTPRRRAARLVAALCRALFEKLSLTLRRPPNIPIVYFPYVMGKWRLRETQRWMQV